MIPNNSRKSKGLTGNALRAWGIAFLALGIAGQSIIQNRILGLGSVSTAELLEAMNNDPSIYGLATAALVFQVLQTCAAPIFSFLLVEGFLHTSNRKNYLIRVCGAALISELPYNLAMSGSLLDLSSRNPLFGLALCLVMIMLYDRYQEKGFSNTAIKSVISVAAFVWAKMLGIESGDCLVVLCGVLWAFRNKPTFRNMAACAAAAVCSMFNMFYLASPMAAMALFMYNGEPGERNRVVNYAAYPVMLLAFGIVAQFI